MHCLHGGCAWAAVCCRVTPAAMPREWNMPSSLIEFSNALADTVERASHAVIAVLDGGREGVSGTVWREGVAITAEHTIRGLEELAILLPGGEKAKARVTGRDHGTDIAILEVNTGLEAASI